jgi:hypothetical protein
MPRPRRVIVVPARPAAPAPPPPPTAAEQEAELQENSRKIAEQSKEIEGEWREEERSFYLTPASLPYLERRRESNSFTLNRWLGNNPSNRWTLHNELPCLSPLLPVEHRAPTNLQATPGLKRAAFAGVRPETLVGNSRPDGNLKFSRLGDIPRSMLVTSLIGLSSFHIRWHDTNRDRKRSDRFGL